MMDPKNYIGDGSSSDYSEYQDCCLINPGKSNGLVSQNNPYFGGDYSVEDDVLERLSGNKCSWSPELKACVSSSSVNDYVELPLSMAELEMFSDDQLQRQTPRTIINHLVVEFSGAPGPCVNNQQTVQKIPKNVFIQINYDDGEPNFVEAKESWSQVMLALQGKKETSQVEFGHETSGVASSWGSSNDSVVEDEIESLVSLHERKSPKKLKLGRRILKENPRAQRARERRCVQAKELEMKHADLKLLKSHAQSLVRSMNCEELNNLLIKPSLQRFLNEDTMESGDYLSDYPIDKLNNEKSTRILQNQLESEKCGLDRKSMALRKHRKKLALVKKRIRDMVLAKNAFVEDEQIRDLVKLLGKVSLVSYDVQEAIRRRIMCLGDD